jgi:hypothetical protein
MSRAQVILFSIMAIEIAALSQPSLNNQCLIYYTITPDFTSCQNFNNQSESFNFIDW